MAKKKFKFAWKNMLSGKGRGDNIKINARELVASDRSLEMVTRYAG